ncbi:TonB-dependent receptor [Methylocapsa acidiphila]|uniref:TonB-dependent receptor n=1 Tax=Methylocapsa acidiphila TaxID=133552 RepID=UPI00041C18DD|nr:TonB-dependent receptor [Methylocapsa acidiphila]
MNLMNSSSLACLVGLPICLSLSAPTTVFAQDAAPSSVEGHVEDVVVTAPPADTVEAISQAQATKYQETPQASTVITKSQLEALQITNLLQAQKLEPSLQIRYSNVRNLSINIRGFGAATSNATDGIFGGVPVYIDGVYQPRPGQAIFDIPDLQGIEVLKGPQGTSGGQDSTGGVVNITTALPSFTAQETAEASYGNYNYVQIKGTATGAIADTDWAAFRLSVFGTDRNGYIDNVNGGQKYNDWHDKGARGQILIQPNNDLSIRLVFDYSHINQACCLNLYNGAVTNYANGAAVSNNFFTRIARLNYQPLSANALGNYQTDVNGYTSTAQETEGAAAIINYNINGYTISNVLSYRGWDFHPNNRTDGTIEPQIITNTNGHVTERSVQEELKISTPKGQPVEATGGVFYLYEALYDWGLTTYGSAAGAYYASPTLWATNPALANATYNYLGRQSYDNPKTNEIAPYIQDVWHAAPNFDVTTGLRYSYYDKTMIFRQYQFAAEDLSSFTPAQQAQAIALRNAFIGKNGQYTADTHQGIFSALASASYKFTPDAMGYVTWARGGRGGGPNAVANLPTGAPTTVKPETVNSYEVGLKSAFFDQRLLVNMAAFVMYNQNYITNETSNVGSTPITYLGNAKEAVSRGVELDIRGRPIDDITTYASFTYNDTYFRSFKNSACPYELSYMTTPCDLTGKPLSNTPKFAMATGFEYSHKLDVLESITPKPLVGYFGADFTYQTGTYSNSDDSIYSYIPAYGLLNLHAGVRFEDASWDLSAWAHNALNNHYFINLSAATSIGAGVIGGNVSDPLMVGVTLKAKL